MNTVIRSISYFCTYEKHEVPVSFQDSVYGKQPIAGNNHDRIVRLFYRDDNSVRSG